MKSRFFKASTAAVFALVFVSVSAGAQEEESYPLFRSNVKGFLTFSQFQTFDSIQSTKPYWKKSVDLNSLELKGEYYLTRSSEIEFEIEIEHGGTGVATEYDPLEEFGEFETEIERGGEVALSEFYYRHLVAPLTWIKIGKVPIYISLSNVQASPLRYASILASQAEPNMLPPEWRDIGVEVQKRIGFFSARAALTNGLNSEFFRKYNWIGGGYQRRLETINADSMAATASIEYGDLVLNDGVVLSIYRGDSGANRSKRGRLDTEANVSLVSLFGSWHFFERFGIRGQFIRGELGNSDAVSKANSALPASGNPGAYSSLGHKAGLEMLELSYQYPLNDTSNLTPFISMEHVNTMSETEGTVVKDDRYNQLFSSVGLMWTWQSVMYLKGLYSNRSTSLVGLPDTSLYQLAFGFDFQGLSF